MFFSSFCLFPLIASEVTEIRRISVVMHVSYEFNHGKLQL